VFDDTFDGFDTGTVAHESRLKSLFSPATIAIHDNGNVFRD
jgi:hypothetical protein